MPSSTWLIQNKLNGISVDFVSYCFVWAFLLYLSFAYMLYFVILWVCGVCVWGGSAGFLHVFNYPVFVHLFVLWPVCSLKKERKKGHEVRWTEK